MSEKVSVTVRMPAEMQQALKILAIAEDRSLSKQIVRAISEWLEYKKGEEGRGCQPKIPDYFPPDQDPWQWSTKPLVASWPPSNPHPYFTSGGVSLSGYPGSGHQQGVGQVTVNSINESVDISGERVVKFTIIAIGDIDNLDVVQNLKAAAKLKTNLA